MILIILWKTSSQFFLFYCSELFSSRFLVMIMLIFCFLNQFLFISRVSFLYFSVSYFIKSVSEVFSNSISFESCLKKSYKKKLEMCNWICVNTKSLNSKRTYFMMCLLSKMMIIMWIHSNFLIIRAQITAISSSSSKSDRARRFD